MINEHSKIFSGVHSFTEKTVIFYQVFCVSFEFLSSYCDISVNLVAGLAPLKRKYCYSINPIALRDANVVLSLIKKLHEDSLMKLLCCVVS